MSKRLYDIATRIQMYAEGVAAHQTHEFNRAITKLGAAIRTELNKAKYDNLDSLTKNELNELLKKLRAVQTKVYNAVNLSLIATLERFMAASLEVNRIAWVTEKEGEEEPLSDREALAFLKKEGSGGLYGLSGITGDNGRFWAQIKSQPIPANGFYLLPFLDSFSSAATARVENRIRQGWANKQDVRELINDIYAEGDEPSAMRTTYNQGRAAISTAFAHIAAMTSAGVASALHSKYTWVSVMDERTTKECSELDGMVFTFGDGPTPPGHYGCRSLVAPYEGNAPNETFNEWKNRQSEAVKNYDFEPLTVAQFSGKIGDILEV